MQDGTETGQASFPLSAAQRPLWLIDRGGSRRGQQVEGCLLHVQGEIDKQRLDQAVTSVVARHPALRIACPVAGGQPVQRVHATVPWSLSEADFSAMAPEPAHAEAMNWAARLGRVPFDLSTAPLWRAGIARLPGRQTLLVLFAHHLICDGWTLRLLLSDLSAGYRAGAAGPPELQDLAPYPQCLLDRDDRWRRNSAVTRFWRSLLEQCVAPRLGVPGSVPASGNGAVAARARVTADVSRSVREVARQHRVTAFLMFAAAYAITIGHFSGVPLVPLATASHGRGAPGLRQVAGVFTTMFVLPVSLAGQTSVSEFLGCLRQEYQRCLANREILLEELALERKLTREPFFRHVISYHPAGFTVSSFGGMPAVMDLLSMKHETNELEFHVRELGEEFALQLRCDPAVLDAACAQEVLDHLSQVLVRLVTAPEDPGVLFGPGPAGAA